MTAVAYGVAFVSLLHSLEGSESTARGGAEELTVVREAVREQLSRLRSLKAVVRSWHVAQPHDVVVCVVAAKGQARYESFWHGNIARLEDDPRSVTRCFDGTELNVFHHYERRYETTTRFAVQPYLGKLQCHWLFECLGWWPPEDPAAPLRRNGEPEFLLDVLSDPRLRLAGTSAVVDGHRCMVVEVPGVVRLWIDDERRVVRRREQLRTGQNGNEQVLALYSLRDFAPYGKGVWLPHRVSRHFPLSGVHTVHSVEPLEVNTVRDTVFALEKPPGTLVYDRDLDTYYQVPGGVDGLENVARRIRESIAAHGGKQGQRSLSDVVVTWIVVGLLYFAGLMAGRPMARHLFSWRLGRIYHAAAD